MNSFLLNFWIILRNCRNKCSCSFSVTSFFTCQVLNTNTDSTIVNSYFCKVQILKSIFWIYFDKVSEKNVSWWHFTSIYVRFSTFNRVYSQMPLRNVLRSNVIKIEMLYLGKLREKDVSHWHLALRLGI